MSVSISRQQNGPSPAQGHHANDVSTVDIIDGMIELAFNPGLALELVQAGADRFDIFFPDGITAIQTELDIDSFDDPEDDFLLSVERSDRFCCAGDDVLCGNPGNDMPEGSSASLEEVQPDLLISDLAAFGVALSSGATILPAAQATAMMLPAAIAAL